MNSVRYIDVINEPTTCPCSAKLCLWLYFNKIILLYIQILDSPARVPDLNVIKNCWENLLGTVFTNRNSLTVV